MKALTLGLLAALICGSASAQSNGDPALLASAQCYSMAFGLDSEQRTLFCEAIASGDIDGSIRMDRINRALSAIPGHSQPNAMLRSAKGSLLVHLGDFAAAEATFREALIEYNDLPPLAAAAVHSLTFSDRFPVAAEYFVRLSGDAPPIARLFPNDVVGELLGRLEDGARYDAVHEVVSALRSIDYQANDARGSRISKAMLRNAARHEDRAAARKAMDGLDSPSEMIEILSDKAFEFAWADVPWADEEKRPEIVRDWVVETLDESEAGPAYVPAAISAISAYISPDAAVNVFQPIFDEAMGGGLTGYDLFDFAFWISPLATAHALAGDLTKAEAVYRDAAVPLSKLDSAAKFNLDANLALLLVNTGKPAEALPVIEGAIADLTRMDPANPALLPMHGVRVRALHGLGRDAEAADSLDVLKAAAASPAPYISALLLTGREDDAREVLVAALRSDIRYPQALGFLQSSPAVYRTTWDKSAADAVARLGSHPDVAAALEGRGRIVQSGPIFVPDFDFVDFDFEGDDAT